MNLEKTLQNNNVVLQITKREINAILKVLTNYVGPLDDIDTHRNLVNQFEGLRKFTNGV